MPSTIVDRVRHGTGIYTMMGRGPGFMVGGCPLGLEGKLG